MNMIRISKRLILLSALLCAACSSEAPPQAEVLRPVRYHVVKADSISTNRSFSGVSVAATETKISFRVGGSLEKLMVKVGQKVKQGDLIAALDDWDMQLKFEEAKAAVLNAHVQESTANANLIRVRKLYENNNVALSEYEQAKNTYASARADFEVQTKQLDQHKNQLQYTIIRSPMNGIVTEIPVAKNENINAGEVVAVLSSSEDIEIEVGVPETYIAPIQTGMDAEVIFSSLPTQQYAGVVTEVAYVAAEYSTYPVTIRLKKPASELRPGMPAEATFAFLKAGKAIFAPSNAIAEDTEGNYVFLVQKSDIDKEGIIKRRAVIVGELTDRGFIVSEGLQEGDAVVTSGVSKISDGMKVRFDSSL